MLWAYLKGLRFPRATLVFWEVVVQAGQGRLCRVGWGRWNKAEELEPGRTL